MGKRTRITEALVELSAERGYEATSIAAIVRRAGVARKTLYDNFAGKEEVFLTALDDGVSEALRRTEDACEAAADRQQQIEAGLAAFLGCIDERPALAASTAAVSRSIPSA